MKKNFLPRERQLTGSVLTGNKEMGAEIVPGKQQTAYDDYDKEFHMGEGGI